MEKIIEMRKQVLDAINEDDKPTMSIDRTAKLLGIDKECLRVSIANGTCPFGVGGYHRDTGTQFGRVSKLALWNWMRL